MKNLFIKTFLLIASTSFLFGCSNDNDITEEDKFVDYVPEVTQNEKVYMTIFDNFKYTPDSKYTYDVTYDDPSLVSYSNGEFISNNKTGSTTVHFTCGIINYNVDVDVTRSSIVPAFDVQYKDISMLTQSTFSVDVNLSYNGRNVIDYIGDVEITNEENNGYVTATYNKDDRKVIFSSTDKGAGVDKFTIYTEFLGYTLSRSVTVTTKFNNSFSLSGNRLTFNNVGPVYKISTYKYDENPINLATDLILRKGNSVIPFSEVTVTSGNESIVGLDGSTMVAVNAGNSYLDITYEEQTIRVYVEISKPLLKTQSINLSNKEFNLDMKPVFNDNTDYSREKPNGYRSYTHGSTTEKVIDLPGDEKFDSITEIKVNGRKLTFSDTYYSIDKTNDKLKIKNSIFDESIYGLCPVEVSLDAGEYLVKYTFNVYFITKILIEHNDFVDNIQVRYNTDQIYGVYKMGNDIETNELSGSYINLMTNSYYSNENYGFKGILDGDNHKISNVNVGSCGIGIKFGSGAVIKNLIFDNVYYTSTPASGNYSNTIFGRYLYGATVENVKINLSDNSTPNTSENLIKATDEKNPGSGSYGMLVNEHIINCSFKDITINANGKTISRLFGNKVENSTFENVVVNAQSVKYMYLLKTSLSGVSVHKV